MIKVGALFTAMTLFSSPGLADALSSEQAVHLQAALSKCVEAIRARSSTPFKGWERSEVRVPGVYLIYEEWFVPNIGFKVVFGQRGDAQGDPYICRLIRTKADGDFLNVDQKDRDIVDWANSFDEITLGDAVFVKGAAFANAVNAESPAACLNGQTLIFRGDITNKGAASIGIGLPVLEMLACGGTEKQ